MTLKTLKDLDSNQIGFYRNIDEVQVFRDRIRAEAIKWVKRLKDKKFYDNKENLYWFIEHFFNITEEDLK